MTSIPLKLTLAGLLAIGSAASAFAQAPNYDDPTYQQQLRDYQAQQQDYQNKRDSYEAQKNAYDAKQDAYQASRDAYDIRRGAYEAARADYDRERADYEARYGAGTWVRRWPTYDAWYAANRTRYDTYPQYAANDVYRAYAGSPCEQRGADGRIAAGGVIGALAGAAVGANVAGRGDGAEGAVLGAVVGGAIGAGVASNTARCDAGGYYFAYDQTVPYREASWARGRPSGRYGYDDYMRMGCRLAPAPAYVAGGADYRYVRVCPDRDERYRITG